MTATIGSVAVLVGAGVAAFGALLIGAGIVTRRERWMQLGSRYVPVLAVAAALAVAAMQWALLGHDFSLRYVAENGSTSTPTLYTIAGMWASLEGSILLWGLILAVYLGAMWWRHRAEVTDPLVGWALVAGAVVAVFFFGLMAGPANPFEATPGPVPLDGRGPNPLLQNHPLMALHPPMLYLGYVGFTIPFAFAIAALVTGRLDKGWLARTRRTTLVAWGFLTAGIVLGAWWSYEVLGWGGYFAWDPVENASLLPWLTATAYLHSVMVQERRGMLRVWNLSLVIASFSLTILGTFLTRSGVVVSVHAFSQSSIGGALLVFLAFVTLGGVALIAWRGDSLASPTRVSSPISRDAAFLANNVVFAAFAFVVLLGTTFPLLAEAINGQALSVGEPYFERMTVPLGLSILFLMAVAPNLPWRSASAEVLKKRLGSAAWFGIAVMLVTAVAGARGLAQLVSFGLAGFTMAAIVNQIRTRVRTRAEAYGEGPLTALWRTATGNRRFYGGLVVHVGVVVIAVALAASQGYATHTEVSLGAGEGVTLGDLRLTYLGSSVNETAQKTTITADVSVDEGGSTRILSPALSIFPGATSAIGTPAVSTGLTGDLYLTLVSSPNQAGRVTVGVFLNPLIVWLWIGGGVMVAGTGFAAWPGRRRIVGAAATRKLEAV